MPGGGDGPETAADRGRSGRSTLGPGCPLAWRAEHRLQIHPPDGSVGPCGSFFRRVTPSWACSSISVRTTTYVSGCSQGMP
jgi:hypothetical protein